MNLDSTTLVMIPKDQLIHLLAVQRDILRQLKELNGAPANGMKKYITANEFMKAVNIGRTKFDQLVQSNKIKIIKKKRKIYLPFSEIDRYFSDASIL